MVTNVKENIQSRPLSWSQISTFEYDKESWFQKYVLKEKQEESKEMLFGKKFADAVEDNKPLAPITIFKEVEHEFKSVFCGIPLVGFADTFNSETYKQLGEYKTSKKLWNQKKVDNHGQLTMYCFMNYINNKVRPEDVEIFLECVQTTDSDQGEVVLKEPVIVHHFKTKRTMDDIIQFGKRINNIIIEMQDYCDNREEYANLAKQEAIQ